MEQPVSGTMIDAVEIEGCTIELPKSPLRVPGYKHSAVPIMCATILPANGFFTLNNLPNVEDTRLLAGALKARGAILSNCNNSIEIRAECLSHAPELTRDQWSLIHGSTYLLPAILGRFGRAVGYLPGGCSLVRSATGLSRPIEHVLRVMRLFGASIDFDGDIILAKAPGGKLNPAYIDVADFSDAAHGIGGGQVTGATKTALILAAACRGTTIIRNAVLRDAGRQLSDFLSKAGCQIELHGRELAISSTGHLSGVHYSVMDDPTFIITMTALAIRHKQNISFRLKTDPSLLRALRPEFSALRRMGTVLEINESVLTVRPPSELQATNIDATSTGLNTDSQPFLALTLLGAMGASEIRDRVWPDRFEYAEGLRALGAMCDRRNGAITVSHSILRAPNQELQAHDTRAAAVYLLATLEVRGMSRIRGIRHLARGYEDIFETLQRFGAKVRRL